MNLYKLCNLIIICCFIFIEIILHKHLLLNVYDKYPNSVTIFVLISLQYFCFVTTLINYIFASFMDPGYLTEKLYKEIQNDPMYCVQVDDNGEKCHCYVCNKDRPLRCYHCQKCKKCVMVYDHHDNLLFNCVGHRNYKVYYGFLFMSCCYIFLNLLLGLIKIFDFLESDRKYLVILCSICLILLIILIPKLYLQTLLLFKNTTLHELNINQMEQTIFKRHKRKFYNKYNTGNISGNIRCRFGPFPLLWFLPTPNEGKGYIPEINPMYISPYEFTSHDNYESDVIRRRF